MSKSKYVLYVAEVWGLNEDTGLKDYLQDREVFSSMHKASRFVNAVFKELHCRNTTKKLVTPNRRGVRYRVEDAGYSYLGLVYERRFSGQIGTKVYVIDYGRHEPANMDIYHTEDMENCRDLLILGASNQDVTELFRKNVISGTDVTGFFSPRAYETRVGPWFVVSVYEVDKPDRKGWHYGRCKSLADK